MVVRYSLQRSCADSLRRTGVCNMLHAGRQALACYSVQKPTINYAKYVHDDHSMVLFHHNAGVNGLYM